MVGLSDNRLSHIATLQVDVPPGVAFDYLTDPLKLGRWSIGCFDTRPAGCDGIYTGTSLYDGERVWFRITADQDRRWIDFHLGAPDRLVPRIAARVVPGNDLELPDHTCLVSLIAWRNSGMDDERWERLRTAHDAEIWLIKVQIEQDHLHNRG
jgi:hypothetical protein